MPTINPLSFNPSKISDREWGYLAGLIDGEGSIVFTAGGQHGLEITNTSARMIDFCMRFGGNWYHKQLMQDHHKKAYRWRNFAVIDVNTILINCLPSIIIKRRLAELAIEQINHRLMVARGRARG